MKNQNDLIVSIVCGVLALGGIATLYFTKREPQTPAAAPKATLTAPAVPTATVPRLSALPGGVGGAAGGAAAFGGARGFGGPMAAIGGAGAGPATAPGGRKTMPTLSVGK